MTRPPRLLILRAFTGCGSRVVAARRCVSLARAATVNVASKMPTMTRTRALIIGNPPFDQPNYRAFPSQNGRSSGSIDFRIFSRQQNRLLKIQSPVKRPFLEGGYA